MKKTVIILSVLALLSSSCGQANSKTAGQASPNNEETTTEEIEVSEDTITSRTLFTDMAGNLIEVCQDTIINDTLFLVREKSEAYYHAVFIDKNKSSKFYDAISCFGFDEYDNEHYNATLEYLKENNITLKRKIINGLPLKWIAFYQYKGNFYTYKPSDFMNHYKISITDTTFIDYEGEGPVANEIIDFTKIDNYTFRFHLTGSHKANRELVIYIIDSKNGIAVFEDKYTNAIWGDKEESTYLMIAADKIKNFPIIVNYCETMKQNEFEFDELDYKKIILRKLSK